MFNLKNFSKEKIQFTIVSILLVIFSICYEIQKLYDGSKKVLLGVVLLTILIEGLVLYFINKHKKTPIHKIYLLLAIVFGIIYILAFPPSQLPDDPQDFGRSLEVSEFNITSEQYRNKFGRKYSENINKVYSSEKYKDISNTSNLKLNGKKEWFLFANKALYNFVCYIPQAIGIGIGRLLNLPILIQILLGKICNYSLFVLLLYLSIKYIPYKKELVAFIGLLPITLQEAASLSPDALAIAASIALISFVLWARRERKVLTIKQLMALALLSIALSLCKIVYLPLCFLIFLIPKECFKTKNKYLTYTIILSIIVVILNLVWLKYSSRYLIAFSHRSNSSEQLKYILTNPIKYLVVLLNTLDNYIIMYLSEIVGYKLGKLNIFTSSIMVVISLFILINLIKEKDKNIKDEFNNLEKIFILLIVLGITLLTFTSLYLQWNQVKANIIEGIQGRYFIPLLLPLSCLFMNKQKEKVNESLLLFMIINNIMALTIVIITFI